MLTDWGIYCGPKRKTVDGHWIPVLPVVGPLVYRLRDAWEVLRGRAHAICESRREGGQ